MNTHDKKRLFGGLAVAVLAAVAVAALVLAMSARSHANHLTREVAQVKEQLAVTNTKLLATQKVDLSDITKKLATMTTVVTHLQYCLPELKQAIDGVTFNGASAVTPGYLASGYITNMFNISRFCADAFIPTSKSKP